ncbi:alkaline phosphatase D family protein [Candidatus Entotheonella palauensis]|uniref:alkaline phosphatase D family protein n=1 Tax=Candidatus Entotheonella palauensis TaxID=93172 RepID=UPI000B7F28F3|nr:alkaline phosphatase D family protein [Candidatus Entotheonella palauensis]
MSGLREPSLGPIVGHTTAISCRLWIRGADLTDRGSSLAEDRRTVGVLAVMTKNRRSIPIANRPAFYFRLHREFDRTGTFNLGVDDTFRMGQSEVYTLDPDTIYTVRVGSLALDDVADNDEMVESAELLRRLPPAHTWIDDLMALDEAKSEAVFRTFPATPDTGHVAGPLSFLIGSCHYPGMFWKQKRADRIFKPIFDHYSDNPDGADPRFILIMGDQIYADMFNRLIPIGLADTFEEFQERYLTAFGSPNMRQLLRHVPTYMILDDHEIEDNWTQDRIEDRFKRVVFNLAIDAYRSYQWSHGPRTYGEHLYYHFDCGGYPFFVVDGHTQRYKDDDPESLDDNHLLGRPSFPGDDPAQLEVLCDWLSNQQRQRGSVPKFIVTSTAFVPNAIATTKNDRQKHRSDSWAAYPMTRRYLLRRIIDNNIQNVVFLSGDLHCSNVAEISFRGTRSAERLKACSITSSAFYWPFPFSDGEPSHYVHDSTDSETRDTFEITDQIVMDYQAYNFTQKDNFCQVEINPDANEIVVRVKDRDGQPVQKGDQALVSRLRLAPWS